MADRSWMNKPRLSAEYFAGAKEFIKFASANNVAINRKIKCPCLKCNNCLLRALKTVFNHLICNGICPNYTQWYYHGESSSSYVEERCRILEERCNELELTAAALRTSYKRLEIEVGRKLLAMDALKNAVPSARKTNLA
ncbi:unnamed protein product [Victoria cruziana]